MLQIEAKGRRARPFFISAPRRALPRYLSRLVSTESLRIHPLSAAHTQGKDDGDGLTEGVRVATVEVHAPREAGDGGEGSRRTVERLHVAEGMSGREPRATGVSWVTVHQARQLLERREPPALAITDGQLVAMDLSIQPGEGKHGRRRLLPDEPGFPVEDGRAAPV